MENITHSLVGAALADAALRPAASRGARRLFFAAGLAAANAPDLDLLYTGITPMPLGYLLHHRGHTHTVPGLAGQMALIGIFCVALPIVRSLSRDDRLRLAFVIAAGLASHLLLDAGNSYGVHPYWPLDNRWYFGDAIFISEPWLLAVLGVAAVLNARTRYGQILAGCVSALPALGLWVVGLITPVTVITLMIAVAMFVWAARPRSSRWRAAAALTVVAASGFALFGLSRMARAEVIEQMGTSQAHDVLDVILTPNPALPLCYSVIVIDTQEAADVLRMRRGAFSFAPRWRTAPACPLFRAAGAPTPLAGSSSRLAWSEDVQQSIAALQVLEQSNCRARAWLRFGRAPVVRAGRMFDLRFENPLQGNFTAMALGHAETCPGNVPAWGMPRDDLLSDDAR